MAKFILLKDYITKWYDFQTSLTHDDSEEILERLKEDMKKMNLEDGEINVNDDTIDIDLIDDTVWFFPLPALKRQSNG